MRSRSNRPKLMISPAPIIKSGYIIRFQKSPPSQNNIICLQKRKEAFIFIILNNAVQINISVEEVCKINVCILNQINRKSVYLKFMTSKLLIIIILLLRSEKKVARVQLRKRQYCKGINISKERSQFQVIRKSSQIKQNADRIFSLDYVERIDIKQLWRVIKYFIIVLLILLNYAIDLNLIKEFLVTLLHISKFLLLCKRYQESISYFQQTKKCSKMMLEYVYLIECYIGLGRCSYQINLNEESINFLQKGLEYAWYKNDTEKEIIIYDMIGLNYYKLGNIDKAKIYHQKYTQGLIESKNSIRKIICDSKIKDMENKSKIFKPINIDLQLLLQLNIQIFSLDKLSSLNHKTTLRKEFKLEQDYHKEFKKKQLQIQTILQQQQFNERIVEQNYVKDKYIQKIQSKTSTYHEIESAFKRKIQMLKKKNKYRVETQRTISFKQKKTLQEQIEIRLNRDSKNEDWYKKLTDQICRDRTFNLRTIKDKVLFKQDTKQRNKLEIFKVFIKSYFQSILELP